MQAAWRLPARSSCRQDCCRYRSGRMCRFWSRLGTAGAAGRDRHVLRALLAALAARRAARPPVTRAAHHYAAEPWLGTPHQRSLSATRATAPASHYHLDRTRPWAHTATVGAAVPRMAEFREIKLRPLDANSIERGLQSSTRDRRFPVPGSAPAATGHVLSAHLAITGRGHQR